MVLGCCVLQLERFGFRAHPPVETMQTGPRSEKQMSTSEEETRKSARMLFGTTIAGTTVRFVLEQARFVASEDWEVHLVCSPTAGVDVLRSTSEVVLHEVHMTRRITPLQDLRSLAHLLLMTRQIRPDVVVYGTPKAGLLGLLASAFVRTPIRVYVLHGLRGEGLQGVKRFTVLLMERIACKSATHIISVSPSLKRRFVELSLCPSRKIVVLGSGSFDGVNVDLFHPPTDQERAEARSRWGFQDNEVVIGFVGRMVLDKGVLDLIQAIELLVSEVPVRVMLIGREDDPESSEILRSRIAQSDGRIVRVDYMASPLIGYWAMDIFVLPSHREGLGQVALEASATGLPVVTTTATGCQDATLHGVTGLLVEPQDPPMLQQALLSLIENEALRQTMGANGREWVVRNFESSQVRRRMIDFLLTASRDEGRIANVEPSKLGLDDLGPSRMRVQNRLSSCARMWSSNDKSSR